MIVCHHAVVTYKCLDSLTALANHQPNELEVLGGKVVCRIVKINHGFVFFQSFQCYSEKA